MRRLVWIGILLGFMACGGEAPTPGLIIGGDGLGGADGSGSGDGVATGPCTNDDDCPGGRCDPFEGICVDCLQDDHCPKGQACVDRECVAPGTVCVPGRITCVDGPAMKICNGDGSAWLPEEACDDGLACTEDICVSGEGCAFVPDYAACDDGNECTVDSCDPEDGCVHAWSGACGEAPLADAMPKKIDFGLLLPGENLTKILTISNLGLGTMEISGVEITGDTATFSIVTDDGDVGAMDLDPPLEVEPGGEATLTLRFQPLVIGDYVADLAITTNDPNRSQGVLVVSMVGGSVDTNCIEATPTSLDFGATAMGAFKTKDVTISNCGEGLIPIYDIQLLGDAFSLESIVGTPMDLDVGEFIVLKVGYFASAAGAVDAGHLHISNGAPSDPNLNIPLSGTGLSAGCPIAVIQSTGGDSALPLDEVQFVGANSSSPNGDITDYQWSLTSVPEGALTAFWPNAFTMNPKLWIPLVGDYVIDLDVWDEAGNKSCDPDSFSISVVPAETLYFELSWETPGDPNEADYTGTDLNLHLVHPLAEGPDHDGDSVPDGWYDASYDCFWGNMSPSAWGAADPGVDDDPVLIWEDNDGAGPEVIAFDLPEDGVGYRIGVVFWDSADMGAANARVRIFADGALTLDTGPVLLVEEDLWEVGTVSVTGVVATITQPTSQKIIADYPKPFGG